MPLTPQITLTAKLQDVTGAAAGNTASPAVLRIALAGFGLVVPCVPATSNLVRVGPEDFYDTGSGVSVTLWGNDVINPAGTYYAITLLDGDGNILQCGAYQFIGTATIDLSSAAQIFPNPPIPPNRGGIYIVPIIGGIAYFNGQGGKGQSLTLTQNVTSNAANFVAGSSILTLVKQDATGGWTMSWPTNFKNAPEVNPAPNGATAQLWMLDEDGAYYPFGGATWS